MGRGLRLACEACDYWADLFEPRSLHESATLATAERSHQDSAWWNSYLCPQCVEPIELPAEALAECPRCASPLLDFATAAEELAAVARTRAALDLRSEIAGREQVVQLLSSLGTLRGQEVLPERDAIAAVRDVLRGHVSAGAAAASAWLPLANTAALAGLDAALAAAPSTAACAALLQARLAEADRAIGTLEHLIDEEADLPGVPCPRCGTGHLLHWPIWV
jgi:DNA-directed RNA polymerase subunit RPC12/RpoP